ncbi:DUF5336 domain-containing protein [Streptomyces scopuliridis]|uniref:DUF5336 domain-containing protein n=1 Tax=Streptomyces scopuliridis TaxID=452529 RepID=A0ACD4ZPQ1_9ACTN|nr:hypothetical protein [Streptomyces scopuliridis]WSB36070.1 DUF5336 domain-containing protein [Streptomyces scopuliridis]WSC00374.1 DUF5336 domain-containing protein [Streptomyces scopuliridis]WSC06015.1 DUF5336 domain-containing protein [Streptomyces scopuliridis]
MNIRSLTRGDGVVIGAAVLLFIASFLNFYESSFSNGVKAWDLLGVVMSIHLAGVIAAALIVTARALPQPRKVAGLDLGQFGVALSVFAAWTGLWYLLGDGSAGGGLILGFIAALILAGAAVATPVVPALKVALVGAPKPQTPQPYGGQPGIPGQGYGYPAGQQPYGTQGQPQPYGAQPGQPAAAAQQGGPANSGAAPAGDFSPFWFAVPVARPLFGEDGSPSPIAELAPGTWYLAVEQRGPGLVAQTQDGRRGVLQDTSGIQRG